MASFYSKPADYGTYTQAINLDLVNFVMQSKQQKYDYNLAKIESKVREQLGGLDLERTQDKEYFLQKAQQVISSVGDMSKLDWSKNGVTRQIDSQLNSIIDDRVLNDVIATRNYRSFQQNLQQKRDKNPELYSEINAAYAMNKYGVNDWLQGKSDSVGAIRYEDYTDVGAELKDISENLDKFARVYKRQLPSGDGKYWVTEEGEQLSSQEVRAIAEQQLSNRAKSQMKINGWANYDGGVRSTEEIVSDFSSFKNSKIKEADDVIAALDVKIKNLEGTNSPKVEEYVAQRSKWIDYKDQTASSYDNWIQKGAVDNMTTTLENERVLNSFGNTFSINNMENSLTENPYVLAEFKEMLKRETQAQKIELEARAKTKEEIEDKDQLQRITPTLTRGQEGYTEVNRYNEALNDVTNYSEQHKKAVNSIFNSINDPKIKETIMRGYSEGSGVSKEAYIEARLQELGAESSNIIGPDQLEVIEKLRLRRDRAIEIKKQADQYAFSVLEDSNLDNVIDEYQDNPNIKLLDAEGNTVSGDEFFSRYGITTGEQLNANPEVKSLLLKSYYADKIMNSGGKFDNFRLKIATTLQGVGIKAFGDEEQNQAKINELKNDISQESGMYMRRLTELFSGDEDKALDFLNSAQSRGVGGGGNLLRPRLNPINRDISVTEDNFLDSWVGQDEVTTEAAKYLAETGLSTRNDMVVIPGGGELSTDLTNILRSAPANIAGNIKAKIKDGQSYTMEDVGNGTVNVYFNVDTNDGVVTEVANLPKANVPQSILNEVNFNQETPLFTRENMKEVAAKATMLEDVDTKRLKSLSNMWGISKGEAADLVTKQGLEVTIGRTFPSLVGTDAEPTPIGLALNQMINSDNIVVKLIKADNDFFNQISHIDPKTGVEKVLYVSQEEIPESEYEQAYFNTKYAPQLAVYEATMNALAQTQLTGEERPAPFLKKLMEIYGR